MGANVYHPRVFLSVLISSTPEKNPSMKTPWLSFFFKVEDASSKPCQPKCGGISTCIFFMYWEISPTPSFPPAFATRCNATASDKITCLHQHIARWSQDVRVDTVFTLSLFLFLLLPRSRDQSGFEKSIQLSRHGGLAQGDRYPSYYCIGFRFLLLLVYM